MWVWVCLDLHENVETRERVLRAWWWNIEEWRQGSGVLKIGVSNMRVFMVVTYGQWYLKETRKIQCEKEL